MFAPSRCQHRTLADRGVPGEAIAEAYDAFEKGKTGSPMVAATLSTQTIQESMKLLMMVRSHQVSRWRGGEGGLADAASCTMCPARQRPMHQTPP